MAKHTVLLCKGLNRDLGGDSHLLWVPQLATQSKATRFTSSSCGGELTPAGLIAPTGGRRRSQVEAANGGAG